MDKVKIIATIGPGSSSKSILMEMINAGLNVIRLNFSHGEYEEHRKVINLVKEIREETGKNIGILQDLSGPKIRVGHLPKGSVDLQNNQQVFLKPGDSYSTDKGIHILPISYAKLLEDIQIGGKILLDDGYISLKAEKKTENAIECRVINGGKLKSHKGVNFPGQKLSVSAPTDKDLKALAFGLKNEVDFVALSFVQEREDIIVLKREIERLGGNAQVIAKLERDTALNNLDEILDEADGVMVARGDLGIECDLAMVPVYQKIIVRRANLKGKPVITATQMLESMIHNPLPTRAEVTDVANAIYDGTDAIMLSAETAVGKYPAESIAMMRTIANNVESNLGVDRGWGINTESNVSFYPQLAIAQSICKSSEELKAKIIVANTISGQTARLISLFRPKIRVAGMTPSLKTFYQLSLVWGIDAIYHQGLDNDFMEMLNTDERILLEKGLVEKGDLIVVSAGVPQGTSGGTNIMKLHYIKG
ncbi:MAG: pyruvate kinase [Spirochaetales bacterium]|nr:pyruvate kinase [Spirochaetales bacterium]